MCDTDTVVNHCIGVTTCIVKHIAVSIDVGGTSVDEETTVKTYLPTVVLSHRLVVTKAHIGLDGVDSAV